VFERGLNTLKERGLTRDRVRSHRGHRCGRSRSGDFPRPSSGAPNSATYQTAVDAYELDYSKVEAPETCMDLIGPDKVANAANKNVALSTSYNPRILIGGSYVAWTPTDNAYTTIQLSPNEAQALRQSETGFKRCEVRPGGAKQVAFR
jgi:hypothetical protein